MDNKKQSSQEIYRLIKKLYPICRSITGNGVRQTLAIIQKHIPITVQEVPSGTAVFDWNIPKEWNIKDAYVKNAGGEKVIDFNKSNLHVLNYSVPVHKKVSFSELKRHLYTLPNHPDWIPYLTSYYKEDWGFCLRHRDFLQLNRQGRYEVVIDSVLEPGALTYGELYLPGRKKDEFLFSCYVCHPSLCNDNLSGVALLTFLAKALISLKRTYSYRFLFIPETIGAIAWLSRNEATIVNIKGGLVATCVGDSGNSTYKKTKNGNAIIDQVAQKVLADAGSQYTVIDFMPYGSDERQFSSPGFNLSIGSLMRTPYGRFAQYHASADDLNFIGPEYLADSWRKYLDIIFILENNAKYLNLSPKGEPQLGKKGLYGSLGSCRSDTAMEFALLWVLNFSDGQHSLLDIAVRSQLPFKQIRQAADLLLEKSLLKRLN